MELTCEFLAIAKEHRWKACHRLIQPEDRFFEAGDIACRFTSHKFTCILSHDDAVCEAFQQSSHDSLISCGQLGCSKQFTTLSLYEMHYNTVHRYVCSICRRCFPTQHLLDVHVLEWHDALFKLQSLSNNMYRCLVESCVGRFQTFVDRTNHMVDVHKYPGSFRFVAVQKHEAGSRDISTSEKTPSSTLCMDTSDPSQDTEIIQDTISAECQEHQQSARTFTYSCVTSDFVLMYNGI